MVRLRIRMTPEEVRLLDFLCEVNGVTRSEWLEARIMGEPIVFDSNRALAAAMKRENRNSEQQTTVKRRRRKSRGRTSQLRLTVGLDGVQALKDAAKAEGCSLALLVEQRACKPVTYTGSVVEVTDLDWETIDLLRGLGETANELAHSLNLAVLLDSRNELGAQRGEDVLSSAYSSADDCVHMTFIYRYVAEMLGFADGKDDVRDSAFRVSRARHKKALARRKRLRKEADGGQTSIKVRLDARAAYEIRNIAASLDLSTGEWVLVSCTELHGYYCPFDVEEGLRIASELAKQNANAKQILRALERLDGSIEALGWDFSDASRAAQAMISGIESTRRALFKRMRYASIHI